MITVGQVYCVHWLPKEHERRLAAESQDFSGCSTFKFQRSGPVYELFYAFKAATCKMRLTVETMGNDLHDFQTDLHLIGRLEVKGEEYPQRLTVTLNGQRRQLERTSGVRRKVRWAAEEFDVYHDDGFDFKRCLPRRFSNKWINELNLI